MADRARTISNYPRYHRRNSTLIVRAPDSCRAARCRKRKPDFQRWPGIAGFFASEVSRLVAARPELKRPCPDAGPLKGAQGAKDSWVGGD
jgi:hypothetical protein